MAPRQVEVHRGVREVGVAEQQLDRTEVRARVQQVGRVAVSQRILTLPMNRLPRSFTTVTIPSTVNT